MVLEGGSIDVNGAGLLLTTEECLLSDVQARNPGMTRREIERSSARLSGSRQRVIWLRNGIAGDDTHGHVDDLARFVTPDTVVVASEDDRSDANYQPLRENYALLQANGPSRGEAAHAAPARICRAAPARQLREFLHRQRARAGSDIQRSGRPRGADYAGEMLPGSRTVTGINCTAVDLGLGRAALHDAAAAGASRIPPSA